MARDCSPSRAADPKIPSSVSSSVSVPSDAKAHSGAEVRPQCGIAGHFLIEVIECVLHVDVGRHTGIDLVPSAQIEKKIAWSVGDAEPSNIRVRAGANEAACQISAPVRTKVGEQRSSGVPGPAD